MQNNNELDDDDLYCLTEEDSEVFDNIDELKEALENEIYNIMKYNCYE